MPLLSLAHVTMHFGGPVLLDDVSLDVEPGRKIGVVGANGVGKSTMLNLLAGLSEPVSGTVVRARGVRVAHQAQELACPPGSTVFAEMRRVFGEAHARDARLRDLEARIADALDPAERTRLLAEYEALAHRHEAEGGYDVDRRIEAVLSSLGLPEEAWHRPLEVFSGGERNVIGLARVLLAEPDVMLLDEPSNHLDMDGVEWFVDLVRRTPSAVVMVSHNRHLLDVAAEEIWEVARGGVTVWTGNYGDWQRQKAEALALQERQWKAQQRLIRRIEFQARRLKDMASAYDDPGQAKRAKAMLARIERLDKVERPESEARAFAASLGGGARAGRIALTVKDFSYAYGDRPLFDRANLEIEYGERVCLVGPNGSGKSTLLRELLEHGSWENETLRLGRSVVVGEYRQLHEDALDRRKTLLEWTQEATGLGKTDASGLLHRFLFSHEDLDRTVGTLSGGEKSRLQLARLAHRKVNLLLLDEPTNHLDLQACEQLEDMLEDYEGTLLVVSHDRWFLDRLVNRVVEVEDRRLVSHRATFAEWWAQKSASRRARRKGALELRSQKGAAEAARADGEAEREARKARARDARRMQSELRTLEGRIARAEDRVRAADRALEAHFADGGDHVRGRALSDDAATARAEVERLWADWAARAEALEAVGGAPGEDA
ncbi:MAG: ABC-F family ATP-binding cassette domain-containing protein [Planctomycetes bacterium]|nr:ABC-F family ATP-binding cassette domain-containing protein [Planctomycetota bacterium]